MPVEIFPTKTQPHGFSFHLQWTRRRSHSPPPSYRIVRICRLTTSLQQSLSWSKPLGCSRLSPVPKRVTKPRQGHVAIKQRGIMTSLPYICIFPQLQLKAAGALLQQPHTAVCEPSSPACCPLPPQTAQSHLPTLHTLWHPPGYQHEGEERAESGLPSLDMPLQADRTSRQ